MPTTSGIGYSKGEDAFLACKEAVQQAMKDISDPDLVIVFSSVKYDQEKMLEGVVSVSGVVPLIGCSDAGEITNLGSNKEGVAVMAIKSDSIKFTLAVGGDIAGGARNAGQKLIKELLVMDKDIKCVIVLTDVLKDNGADVVRGIQDVAGQNFLILGGAAGDDFKFQETFVYLNGKVFPSHLVGVGLSGDFSIGVGVRHGWEPIGLPKTVTKSKGAVIEEIENKPAIQIYEDYFGKKAEELKSEPLAVMAITYPLGMNVEGSDELLIRDPITVGENGSITCAAEIPEGSKIRLMLGSKEHAIEAAKAAAGQARAQLGSKEPKAIIVFNCIARNKLFGKHATEEINAMQSILGEDVPIIGFYTYGEQAPLGGNMQKKFSCFHNETAVVVVLGD